MRKSLPQIAMLGSLPPLRALSSYCVELTQALMTRLPIRFLSFKTIYPAFLYPGGALEDDTDPWDPDHPNLQVFRNMTWYNPLTWIKAGLTRADLIHAQWWSLPLLPIYLVVLGLFRLRGKAVVITVHNVVSHERSQWYSRLSGLLYRLGNHFIVHGHRNRDQLIQHHHLPPERISVIPHGPLERFTNTPSMPPQAARQQLGLPEIGPLVLLFGAIRPYKGLDTALQAMALLKEDMPEVSLLVAGKPWMEWQTYQDFIEQHDLLDQIITHLDYIPTAEVGSYFQAADLVILPYHHFDSQSGIGAAALAFSKPLIVTDTGGLPELVGDRRSVIPTGDARRLAEAMRDCLQDRAILKQMAEDAERIRKTISWPRIAEQTIKVYEAACS